eukprot:2818684-Prymnesium_polylepis.1
MSREPALEVGECPLTRHCPQVRRVTHTHTHTSDADPLVGHHALTFFQHSIDERLDVKSNADKGDVLARPDVDLSMIPAH